MNYTSSKINFISFLIILFSLPSYVFCQSNSASIRIESLEQPIFFYGYDFSHLQLVESNKAGKQLTHFLFELNKFLNVKTTTHTFSRMIKDTSLSLVFQATSVLPDDYAESKVVVDKRNIFPEDSLQDFINNYNITDTYGTGCIVLFDCFEKETNITSAYLLLFDNNTRKILKTEHVEHIEKKNYSNMNSWHETSLAVIEELLDRVYF